MKIRRLGRGRRRFRPVCANLDRSHLFQLNNQDNLCLFRAIELLRVRATESRHSFYRYLHNEERQLRDARALKESVKAINGSQSQRSDDNEEAGDGYDIVECGQQIQEVLNEKWPGVFKIFAFETCDALNIKPFYKTEVQQWKNPICIFYEEGHYEAIKTLNKFLGVHAYCLICETPFDIIRNHDLKCRGRCNNCSRIASYGPCLDDGTRIQCPDCNKFFKNRSDIFFL